MIQATTALALNNIGVSLLERKCYSQAMTTLHEALHTLKGSLSDSEEHATNTTPEKIKNAMHCIMHPTPMESSIHLDVLSSDSLAPAAIQAVIRGPSPREGYAIRVDNCDPEAFNYDQSFDTAILLYNLAIAYLCVSTIPNQARSSELTRNALTLFSASYSVLQKYKEEEDSHTNLLFLELIILRNLVAVLEETNEINAAKSMYLQYLCLSDLLQEMKRLGAWLDIKLLCATAA